MQLTPRYGADPVLVLDGDPSAIAAPAIRQRRRLAAALAALDADQWAQPSRCAGWTCRDVIVHLDSTNTFWAFSLASGLAGSPTEFLSTFDPVVSPAQLVAGAAEVSTAEVLERFVASTEALVETWTSIEGAGWSALAEAPPGHVTVSAVTHHALWDSWVHERDVLLPLGLVPDEEPDEIAACLRYVAGLGPALAVTRGSAATGILAIEATGGAGVTAVVEVAERVVVRSGSAPTADLALSGDAVTLVEALSVRTPLAQPVPADAAWLLAGLTETFDA